jgi:hypothetical protein
VTPKPSAPLPYAVVAPKPRGMDLPKVQDHSGYQPINRPSRRMRTGLPGLASNTAKLDRARARGKPGSDSHFLRTFPGHSHPIPMR